MCVNEITPTKFCDKNGLDIAQLYMIRVLQPQNSPGEEQEMRQAHEEERKEEEDENGVEDDLRKTEGSAGGE